MKRSFYETLRAKAPYARALQYAPCNTLTEELGESQYPLAYWQGTVGELAGILGDASFPAHQAEAEST